MIAQRTPEPIDLAEVDAALAVYGYEASDDLLAVVYPALRRVVEAASKVSGDEPPSWTARNELRDALAAFKR